MLETFALILLFFVFITLFYGIIVIHDIPYEISVHRDHPHQDAIHVAGWVSLFTLHTIWPFLWIWATLYRKDRGWGFSQNAQPTSSNETTGSGDYEALEIRVKELESKIAALNVEAHSETDASNGVSNNVRNDESTSNDKSGEN